MVRFDSVLCLASRAPTVCTEAPHTHGIVMYHDYFLRTYPMCVMMRYDFVCGAAFFSFHRVSFNFQLPQFYQMFQCILMTNQKTDRFECDWMFVCVCMREFSFIVSIAWIYVAKRKTCLCARPTLNGNANRKLLYVSFFFLLLFFVSSLLLSKRNFPNNNFFPLFFSNIILCYSRKKNCSIIIIFNIRTNITKWSL